MKIAYKEKRFSEAHLDVIATCNKIISEYIASGYSLTLRQLYYQLVARGIIPNKQTEYKRLGGIVSDGRDCGLIDWDAIEDRTRNLRALSSWDSPESIIRSCANQFRYDLWEGQEFYVEVWVEKEALAGVIQRTANNWDCPWMACRGYMSQSEIWSAGQRFARIGRHRRVVVIHLGDHDPSGIDMTRDIGDRLALYAGRPITVNRIALNFDQVEEYNPPPNPAKMTDSRFESYVAEHGDESWELDALNPQTLDQLMTDAILKYLDRDLWEEREADMLDVRRQISQVADQWEEIIDQHTAPLDADIDPDE